YSVSELVYSSYEEVESGAVVKVALNNKEAFCVVMQKVQKPEFECSEILKVTDNLFSKSQIEVAEFISTYYISPLGLSLSLFTPFYKGEQKKNSFNLENKIALTHKQKEAYEFALKYQNSLIFGDTGSGKTEVYICLIYHFLKKEKNVVYLLPEISLTPQLENRLKQHFGEMVGIWHSKINKKRKTELLENIYNGKIRVILGARSALFLPLEDIGLIIIDEEHDDSYKANNSPRYNARDVALFYGKKIDAKVVLGSATPNITTLHKIPYFRLMGNYFETDKDIIYEDATDEISEGVLRQIDSTLSKNEQIIIFLPTRAHFKYIKCKECGDNVICPFCSVSMSLHKHHNLLKCHYCNFTSRVVNSCPKCGNETMEAIRLGTAEVVDRLKEVFSDKRIEKFDRDEITTDNKLKKTLNDFKSEKIDILVGTQMLSKGHDYHKVGASIILGIDNVLALNDFRSREKALSLSIQLAGRSGRKNRGVVFLQTKNREFFEKYLQNYDLFFKDEIESRRELYPPLKKLLRVLISHKNDKKAGEIMHKTLAHLEKIGDIEIVGYGKADIEKIANKYRYNILLRSDTIKPLLQAGHSVKSRDIQIDVDPISFS
ncbi:MAG: primosomal protein N', partial [Campylobacteraceae bacterium]|nr:primosomal protein N' [Campylobacteraceae bacterium]